MFTKRRNYVINTCVIGVNMDGVVLADKKADENEIKLPKEANKLKLQMLK